MPEELVAGEGTGGTGTPAPVAKPEGTVPPTTTPKPEPRPGAGGDDVEKRFKGIQNDLARERKARQDLATREAQYKADLDAAQKRIQALAGVNPVSPQDAEKAEVNQRLLELRPDLFGLTKEDIESLKAAAKAQQDVAETTKHYWRTHGRTMVNSVIKEVAKDIGGNLSERQAGRLAAAYIHECQTNEEFAERHENGDATLISEFAKEWVADWFEPARRKVTATEVDRARRVPSGKDRRIVTLGDNKIDVNDPKAVEDLLVKGFQERGGNFGRR